jgi:hypothetical protein
MGVIAACAMHQDEVPPTDWVSLNQRVKKPLTGDGCEGHDIPR